MIADPSQPLAGLTVLDLTQLPPGAYCTVLLADLGADVVRVESPKGRRFPGPAGLSRGKRSVGVDLRHPRGPEVLRRLAAHADVLVENERPGALDERGFGYSHAAVELPALIWCSVSGYGQDGPYARWPGHDLAFAAHSGLLDAVNPDLPWYPQTTLPIPVGALMAAVGILAALRERDRTGRGCQLDISMSESATWLLSAANDALSGQRRGIPDGPDRHLYACAGGTWVAVTAAEPRTWNVLCHALGLDDLVDTLRRWDDPDAVTARLAAVFARRPAPEWVSELGPLGASVVRLNRGSELLEDPQLAARKTFRPLGDTLVPRSPIRIRDSKDERPMAPTWPAGPAGADTRAVLTEAGLTPDEIGVLEKDGAIGPPPTPTP